MKFDIVFDETSRNRDVYDRAVKPLVSRLFDKSVDRNALTL